MQQNLFISIPLLTHYSGTNLTKAYPMPPTFSMQTETRGRFLNVKGRAVEMALAKGTTYLQFLTNRKGLFRPNNL